MKHPLEVIADLFRGRKRNDLNIHENLIFEILIDLKLIKIRNGVIF